MAEEVKGKITKGSPPSEWFKNVAKSIGYSSSDLIKTITPNIHSMVDNNISYGKEIFQEVKQASSDAPSISSFFNADDYVKLAKTALNNTIEDISSGKLYNKERQEAFDDDDFAELMAGLEDGSYTTSDSEKGEEGTGKTVTNNVTINRGVDTTVVTGAVAATIEASKATTGAIISSNQHMMATKTSMDIKASMATLKGLETINDNIAQLVTFQNDSMAKYVGASIKYYDESLEVMKTSMESIVNMSGVKKDGASKNKINSFEDVFSGGFSLESYVSNVKRNLNSMKDDDPIISFISSIFSDKDHLSYLAKSPLAFIAKTVTEKIIPTAIQKTMDQLDKTVTEFLPAMFNRLSNLSESNNPLLATMGRLLGVSTRTRTSAKMNAFERGALPFDGETKKSIVDIIPTYLRKIHSAITGSKEIAFDWQSGTWSDVETMRKKYETAKNSAVTGAYYDQYSEMQDYTRNVRFNTAKDRNTFEKGMNDFFVNLTKTKEMVKFEDTDESRRKVSELSGLSASPELGELLHAMVNNLDRSDKVNLVGSGRYKALDAMNKFFENIENNHTMFNASTLLSGLVEDENFVKDADGNIKSLAKKNGFSGIGNKTDAWGKDDLHYLREITSTLIKGIRVFPTDVAKAKRTGNDSLTQLDREIKEREEKFASMKPLSQKEVQATKAVSPMSDDKAKEFKGQYGIDLTGQTSTKGMNEMIKGLKAERKKEDDVNYTDSFGDKVGGSLNKGQQKFYNMKEKVDNLLSKPADVLNKAFDRIDETLYNIVFGIQNDGRGSFMSHTLDKMQSMFDRVADIAVTKVFGPLADMIGSLFTKVGDGIKENPIINAVKDGVKYWFVGNKNADGIREGGVFSSMLNTSKDMALSLNHSITGVAYKDSMGVTHEKNTDSLFHQTGGLFKDVFNSAKAHFMGDKNSNNPDERRGMITRITDTVGDGMSEWSSFIFGTERDKNKTGTEILAQNTKTLVANTPRGVIGAAAGAGLGALALGGTGWAGGLLTSFFLPGAPLALALAGGALGIATGFEGFNEWAFGRKDYDGTRMGGALMNQGMQRFVKNNKNTLIGGAIAGLAFNTLGGIALDTIGLGFLPSMLSPFGPVGAAIQGIATALVMKSETFLSFMFGEKNIDGKRVNGLFGRLFGKVGKNSGVEANKSVGKKGALIATGILGGMGIGLGVETMLGTMGILGTLLAGPVGPVMGAVAGLAAAITLGSDKISGLLFGKKDEEGNETDGIIGKFSNFLSMNVFQPLALKMKDVGRGFVNWVINKQLPALQFAFEPIAKLAKEVVSGSFKMVKAVTWDLAKGILKTTGATAGFIAKQIGGAVGAAYESIFGTTIKKSIVDPMLSLGEDILDSFKGFGEMFMDVGKFVFKGINEVGLAITKVPAALSMGMLKVFGIAKSAVGGAKDFVSGTIGNIKERRNSKNQGTGEGRYSGLMSDIGGMAKNTLGGAAIFSRYKASDLGRFEDTMADRAQAAQERYLDKRAENRAKRDAEKAELEEVRSQYSRLGYDSKKAALRGANLEKFKMDVIQMTGGVTVEEILNSKKPLDFINKRDRKKVMSELRAVKLGFKGDNLREKLKIPVNQPDPVMQSQKAMVEKITESNDILGQINENLIKALNVGKAGTPMSRTNVAGAMESLIDSSRPSYGNSVESSLSRMMFNRAQQANQERVTHNTLIDANKIPKPTPSQQRGMDDATGGAIASAISSTRGLITKTKQYTRQQVSTIGCGPIVLSMVMNENGTNISAEEIFKYAEENGLVKRGIGVSSDIFKAFASKYGMAYGFFKPTIENIKKAFEKSSTVIARLNTGMGHFVMAYNLNHEENTVMIKDPMGKISGTISLSQFIKYSTHLYVVYKKGVKGILSSTIKGIKNTLSKGVSASVGGSLAASAVQSSNNVMSAIKNATVTPVVIVKTKEQEKEEQDKFDTLMNSIGGPNQSTGGSGKSTQAGIDVVDDTGKRLDTGLPILGPLLRGISAVFGFGKEGYQAAKGALKRGWNKVSSRETRSESFQRAKVAISGAYLNTKAQMARGTAGAMTLGGMAVSGLMKGTKNALKGAKRVLGSSHARDAARALSRAGDISSDANIAGMSPAYRTGAQAEDGFSYVNDGTSEAGQKKKYNSRRDVNFFLKQKAEEAAAEMEASFKTSSVDLMSRIEVNTRRTAEVLEDLADLVKNLTDWLKPFLEGLGNALDKLLDGLGLINIPSLPDDLLFKRNVKKRLREIVNLLKDIKACVCGKKGCGGCGGKDKDKDPDGPDVIPPGNIDPVDPPFELPPIIPVAIALPRKKQKPGKDPKTGADALSKAKEKGKAVEADKSDKGGNTTTTGDVISFGSKDKEKTADADKDKKSGEIIKFPEKKQEEADKGKSKDKGNVVKFPEKEEKKQEEKREVIETKMTADGMENPNKQNEEVFKKVEKNRQKNLEEAAKKKKSKDPFDDDDDTTKKTKREAVTVPETEKPKVEDPTTKKPNNVAQFKPKTQTPEVADPTAKKPDNVTQLKPKTQTPVSIPETKNTASASNKDKDGELIKITRKARKEKKARDKEAAKNKKNAPEPVQVLKNREDIDPKTTKKDNKVVKLHPDKVVELYPDKGNKKGDVNIPDLKNPLGDMLKNIPDTQETKKSKEKDTKKTKGASVTRLNPNNLPYNVRQLPGTSLEPEKDTRTNRRLNKEKNKTSIFSKKYKNNVYDIDSGDKVQTPKKSGKSTRVDTSIPDDITNSRKFFEEQSRQQQQKSANKSGKTSKAKSFMKGLGSIMKGGNGLGIVAGSGVTGNIPTTELMKDAGKNLLSGAKSIGKNVGKNALKFVPGLGLAATAAFGAMDYKRGKENAADIFNTPEGGKVTESQKKAAGAATAAVGAIPFADLIDESLFKGKMKEVIAKIINATIEMFGKATTVISDGWNGLKEGISTKAKEIAEAAKEAWESVKTGIATKWEELKTGITEKVTTVVTAAKEAWETVKTGIATKWEELKTAVTEKVTSIVSSAKTKWEAVKKTIATKWDEAKKAITEKVTSIVKAAKDKWEAVKKTISTKWDEVKKAITEKATSILSSARDKWESIKSAIGKKWDEVKKAITNKIDAAKNALGDFKAALSKAATGVRDKIVEKITNAVSGLKFTFTELPGQVISSITDKVKSAISKVSIKLPGFGGKGGGVGGPIDGTAEIAKMSMNSSSTSAKEMEELAKELSTTAKGCKKCLKSARAHLEESHVGGPVDDKMLQTDPRWSNKVTAAGANMATDGCGPTVAANVVSSLTGNQVLPTEALKFAQDKGLVDANGTNSQIFASFGATKGVGVNPTSTNEENIKKLLAAGNKVILRGDNGTNYTQDGHYVIADGYKNGKVTIKDPMSKQRSGEYDMKTVAKGLTHAFAANTMPSILNSKHTNETYGRGTKGLFSHPLPGSRLTSRYGMRNIGYGNEMHWGVDLVRDAPNPNIQAAADGVVTFAGKRGTYGNVVMIEHQIKGQKWTTVYAHMKERSIKVSKGDPVKVGQNLGIMGNTGRSFGAHLHFEIHKGTFKYTVNNVNPEPYIIDGGNPTPAGFDGPNAGVGVTGSELLGTSATATTANSDVVTGESVLGKLTNMFDTGSLLANDMKSLPGAMQNAAISALTGQSIDLLSGTALDPNGSSSTSAISSSAGEVKNTSFNPKGDKKIFIDKVKPGAIEGWNKYKVLPSLTLGQAAEESGWGKKSIGNNIFGIKKGSSWKGKTQWSWTTEEVNGKKVPVYAEFRDYDSVEDSITDHAKLMTLPRYKNVLAATNYVDAVKAVKAAGYATNSDYVKNILDIIEGNGFMQIDNQVKGKSGDTQGMGGPTNMPDSDNIYDILTNVNKKFDDKVATGIGGPIGTDMDFTSSDMEVAAVTKDHGNTDKGLTATGKGTKEISTMNKNLASTNVLYETTVAKGPSTTVVTTGDGGGWDAESVSRAIDALESIAKNTSDTTMAISNNNTINASYSSEVNGGNGGNGTKSTALKQNNRQREVNKGAQMRNNSILKVRK